MSIGRTDIVRIAPAGDSALLLEFPQRIDPSINARAIVLAERLRRRCGAAVRDAVVGYATVTVYFDPLVVDAAWMEAEMREVSLLPEDRSDVAAPAIEVPVCYDAELGPDLTEVAAFGNMPQEDVIALHSGVEYRVYMVGFVPGFAYMAAVDSRIAAPRRASPRRSVPAGSVAIAGLQTGIYPALTPGGWNIIGRTPLKPYDPLSRNALWFRPGDTVRFRPIPRDIYNGTR